MRLTKKCIKRPIKKLTAVMLAGLVLTSTPTYTKTVNAEEARYVLDEQQAEIADRITEICTENWNEYGVLPSVCIAQAYMESHVGKECYANNLWGLYGGYTSFNSLDEGIYEYLEIINNGLYDDALYHLDSSYQINAIYDGGYCTASKEHYVGGINWIIDAFDLTSYDTEILKNCYMRPSNYYVTWKYVSE